MKLRKKLHNELVDLKGNIRVFARVRYVGVLGKGTALLTGTMHIAQSFAKMARGQMPSL